MRPSMPAVQSVTAISRISRELTLNLLTTTIVAPPSNSSKWQMGFNSAFKELNANNTLTDSTHNGESIDVYEHISKG